MNTSKFFNTSAKEIARHQQRVLVVTLPFLSIPGNYHKMFPYAELTFTSLLPRDGIIAPDIGKLSIESPYNVDNLEQHFKLVDQYWDMNFAWPQWKWLEDDFEKILRTGYPLVRGQIESYKNIIIHLSKLYAQWIRDIVVQRNICAICIYGMGHWIMNAAASVANTMNLTLFVLERGILQHTQILDIDVPYTQPGSYFRQNWERFVSNSTAHLEEHINNYRFCDLYYSDNVGSNEGHSNYPQPFALIVGQCMFDVNLLNAPFNNIASFIDYSYKALPNIDWAAIVYRPHPLSPESYENDKLLIAGEDVLVDRSHPKNILQQRPYVITWNSVMGIEASIYFNCDVAVMDSNCYFKNVIENHTLKIPFLNYLKSVSFGDYS